MSMLTDCKHRYREYSVDYNYSGSDHIPIAVEIEVRVIMEVDVVRKDLI